MVYPSGTVHFESNWIWVIDIHSQLPWPVSGDVWHRRECYVDVSAADFCPVLARLSAVDYRNIRMSNAQNGARIKAWAGPNVGSGIVKNITFNNFIESAVDHPVIIDQVSISSAWYRHILSMCTIKVLHDECNSLRPVSFQYHYSRYRLQQVCRSLAIIHNTSNIPIAFLELRRAQL